MTTKYTKEDMSRARAFNFEHDGGLGDFGKDEAVAQLIAETREAATRAERKAMINSLHSVHNMAGVQRLLEKMYERIRSGE